MFSIASDATGAAKAAFNFDSADDFVLHVGTDTQVWLGAAGLPSMEGTLADPGLTTARHLAAVDGDGDGQVDIIGVSDHGSGALAFVWVGQGGTAFADPVVYSVPGGAADVRAGDIDGDGLDDIVISDGGASLRIVYTGDANIVRCVSLYQMAELRGIAVADWDSDGRDEIAVVAFGTATILRVQ